MKPSRKEFIEGLKQTGKIARDNIMTNASEEERLRFLFEELLRSSAIIKKKNLENEISNHIVSEGRGSEQELPT